MLTHQVDSYKPAHGTKAVVAIRAWLGLAID
jgi:hypothetical protein